MASAPSEAIEPISSLLSSSDTRRIELASIFREGQLQQVNLYEFLPQLLTRGRRSRAVLNAIVNSCDPDSATVALQLLRRTC